MIMGALPLMGCGSGVTTSAAGGGGASSGSYFVDCSASANGDGTSGSPWNSLTPVNAKVFTAGNTIAFRRGTTCTGALKPQGSGVAGSPITITAYGSGAAPILDGQANDSVLRLSDQSYWTIDSIELLHGVHYGLNVFASLPQNGITISNVEATGATFVSTVGGDSGEIFLAAQSGSTASLSNVLVDTVNVHDSTTSRGIFVLAGDTQSATGSKGSNVTVRNSQVSTVYGDGLVVESAATATISGNTVTRSGQCSSCTGPTPVGIWVWNSSDVTIAHNESSFNSSWGVDGGGFDVDYWNHNVTVEYNYAHDNRGYCIAALGANSVATTNTVIRYNICVNNDALAASLPLGEIYLFTWNGGSLSGTQVYNNTLYFSSKVKGAAALLDAASFTGTASNFFRNNLVYISPGLGAASAGAPLQLSNNLYFAAGNGPVAWTWGSSSAATLAAWQTLTGQEANSLQADPLLGSPGYSGAALPTTQYAPQTGSPAVNAGADVCAGISGCSMGTTDFAGSPNQVNGSYSIGAVMHP